MRGGVKVNLGHIDKSELALGIARLQKMNFCLAQRALTVVIKGEFGGKAHEFGSNSKQSLTIYEASTGDFQT